MPDPIYPGFLCPFSPLIRLHPCSQEVTSVDEVKTKHFAIYFLLASEHMSDGMVLLYKLCDEGSTLSVSDY